MPNPDLGHLETLPLSTPTSMPCSFLGKHPCQSGRASLVLRALHFFLWHSWTESRIPSTWDAWLVSSQCLASPAVPDRIPHDRQAKLIFPSLFHSTTSLFWLCRAFQGQLSADSNLYRRLLMTGRWLHSGPPMGQVP